MIIKSFSGYRWWEQKNAPYRESCRKQAIKELVELKGNYDYLVKQTNK